MRGSRCNHECRGAPVGSLGSRGWRNGRLVVDRRLADTFLEGTEQAAAGEGVRASLRAGQLASPQNKEGGTLKLRVHRAMRPHWREGWLN